MYGKKKTSRFERFNFSNFFSRLLVLAPNDRKASYQNCDFIHR